MEFRKWSGGCGLSRRLGGGLLALALVSAGAWAAPAAPRKDAGKPVAAAAADELDGQTVYQVLLGEISLRRGNPELALSALADAARRTDDPKLLIRAIQVAGQGGRHDVALELAQRWARLSPDSVHARQTLIGMYAAFGRTEDMLAQWRLLVRQDPENAGSYLLQINRLVSWMPDRAAALALVERAVAEFADRAEAHHAVSVAALSAGDSARALTAARQAQALKPDWPQPVLVEVQALGRDRAGEAIERLTAFLAEHPDADDIALQRGRLLAGERRWTDARAAFEALAARQPDDHEVLYPLAIIALQQRDFDAADKALRQLLETRFPDKSVVHYHLGLIAEERKDLPAALAEFEQARTGDYAFQAQLRAAQVMARQGRRDAARARLAAMAPADSAQRVRVIAAEAQILREGNDFQGAFDRLAKGLAGQPDEPDLLYDQAMVAERLNRIDVLENNLNRVIALRPDNAHAYNALGYSLAERNQRLDEAQTLIRRALQLAPDDPFILDSMGWVLFRLGKAEEALRHLNRAYGLKADPEIAAHIGEVLWSLGRRADARQIWGEARAKFPDNDVLLGVIQRFKH